MRLTGETGSLWTEPEKEPTLLQGHLCLCNQPLSTYSMHVHYGAGAGEQRSLRSIRQMKRVACAGGAWTRAARSLWAHGGLSLGGEHFFTI